MKTINFILESIITSFALLFGTFWIVGNVESVYLYLIVTVWVILCIIGYISAQRYEKRLESDIELLELTVDEVEKGLRKKDLIIRTRDERIEELEYGLSNQVRATDEAEKERDNLRNAITNWYGEFDITNGKLTLATETKFDDMVFAEESHPETELHICESCNVEMRETKCYYICDVCKGRKKKVVA